MAPAYPKKKPVKPNVQMRQLHWAKIPDAKIKGTMWESDLTDEKVKLDIEEVENLFAANAAKKKEDKEEEGGGDGKDGGNRRKTVNKKPEIVTLLDPKTANNTAIALSRIKMGESAIANALLCGDSAVRPAGSSISNSNSSTALPSHSLTL